MQQIGPVWGLYLETTYLSASQVIPDSLSDKDGTVLDIVEIFKIDDAGRVEEIWALWKNY